MYSTLHATITVRYRFHYLGCSCNAALCRLCAAQKDLKVWLDGTAHLPQSNTCEHCGAIVQRRRFGRVPHSTVDSEYLDTLEIVTYLIRELSQGQIQLLSLVEYPMTNSEHGPQWNRFLPMLREGDYLP